METPEQLASVLAVNVGEIVASLSSIEALGTLRDTELAGKNRVSVLRAIDAEIMARNPGPKVTAKVAITHDGIDYKAGEVIEDITEEQAAALAAVGAIDLPATDE